MTRKGQITIPKKLREVMRLAAGDGVEFELNASGDVVLRKAPSSKPPQRRREAQLRRRAAELLALLRGLD